MLNLKLSNHQEILKMFIDYCTLQYFLLNTIPYLDFATKFELPSSNKKTNSFQANEEALMTIQGMGFTLEQATKALKATVSHFFFLSDFLFACFIQFNFIIFVLLYLVF